MSPEQAEGKPIDARSDLFSLGLILHEMATGVRPFTGDTSLSIISSILKDTPKPITDLNPGPPRDLGRAGRYPKSTPIAAEDEHPLLSHNSADTVRTADCGCVL